MNGHAGINKAFRLVWSSIRGGYIVAPECARGKGKSGLAKRAVRPLWVALTTVAFTLTPIAGLTQTLVEVASGSTSTYVAPNGVSVINISNPNSSGLSHNLFNRYNIDAKGLVLNNSNAAVVSQLAGRINANPNLSVSAQVILNEVVSNNRSVLAGFTEVAGSRAAVIVANPYGITCNGCGFINTDRVTLTTGTPVIDNERLASFRVSGGNVIIGSNGLNASAQEILDIVTRSVIIEGNVNTTAAGVLRITTGNNNWDYDTGSVIGNVTPSGTAPTYGIDSALLGGMYAGQIRLVATEAGVGVRMLGEAAARASDFTINAAGKIEVSNAKISAERDVQVTTNSNASDALNLTDTSLSAKRNLSINATAGGANISGGVLLASADLSGSFGTVTDIASNATLADNNSRHGNSVTLNVTGAASVDGTAWGADNALAFSAASLTASTEALFYTGTTLGLTATIGNLALGDTKARAIGNLMLSANSGQVVFTGGGAQSTSGNLNIVAGGGFSNAGILTADAGSLSLQVDGASNNSGTLNAYTTLSLARKTGGDTGTFTNTTTGRLLSGGNQIINLHGVNNSGAVESAGTLSVTTDNLINSGNLLTYGNNNGNVTLAVATLNNSGTGMIVSAGELTLTSSATTGTGDSVTNSGTVQSAGNMTLSVGRKLTNAYIGQIISGGELTLTSAATEFNTTTNGVLQSTGAMRLGESGHLVNLAMDMGLAGQTEGYRIITDDTLTLMSKSMVHHWLSPWRHDASPRIQARKGMSLEVGTWTGNLFGLTLVASTEAEGNFVNRIRITQAAQSYLPLTISSYGDFIFDAQGLTTGVHSIRSITGSVTVTARDFDINSQTGGIDAAQDFVAHLGKGLNSWDSSILRSIQADRDILIQVAEDGRVDILNTHAGRDLIVTTPGTFFRLGYGGLVKAERHLALGDDQRFVRGGAQEGSYLQSLGTMSIISDSEWDLRGTVEARDQLIMKAATLGGVSGTGKLIFATNPHSGLTASAHFTGLMTGTRGLVGQLHSAGNLNLVFNQGLEIRPWFITSCSGGPCRAILYTGSITSDRNLSIQAASIENSGGTLYGSTGLELTASGAFENTIGFASKPSDIYDVYLSAEDFAAGRKTQLSGHLYISPDLISGGNLRIRAGGQFLNSWNSGRRDVPVAIIANNDIEIESTRFYNSTQGRIITNAGSIRISFTDSSHLSSLGHNGPQDTSSNYGTVPSGLISAAGTLAFSGPATFVNKGMLRATAITGTGSGGLINSGSPTSATITAKSASGGTLPTGPTTVSATTPFNAVTPQALTPGGTLSFGGFSVTLPSKPNGFFVISRDPTSRFLVETNPRFTSDVTVGSDDLRRGLMLAETAMRRLGDNNYEAFLIRQQLIQQTGSNVLRGYGDENNQIRRLMDQAISQSAQAGLVFGQALSPQQIAGLTQDIVWMETINIGGEPVLVPRVYLAQRTRDMITGGATIMAENIDIEGDLKNKGGGTITSSGENLSITAGGNITNQSGTIGAEGDVAITSTGGDIANRGGTIRSGGDMALTASQGNITNETRTSTDRRGNVSLVGATGTIDAGGDLSMDAAQNIAIRGADVSAGGNADLKAGENITIDTIAETSTTRSREGSTKVTTTTVTHTGSNLNVGGNLNLESGNNTTIAGSSANVEGNLRVTTGGDFNVESRQNSTEVSTSNSRFGFGVGGGLFGTTSTQTNDFTGTNVGSSLNVGGNADINSADRVVIQGSDVNVVGDANMTAAGGIEIRDGLDEKRSTTRTSTMTLFSVESSSGSGSDRESQAGSGSRAASASARGTAQAEAGSDINLMKLTTTETITTEKTSVGANLNVGGNLNMQTSGDVTVQGSNVAAGGNLNIEAENVNVLTGRNESTSVTTTNSTALGLFTESSAGAEGSAGAQAQARGPIGTGAGAQASGSASAEATATLGIKTTSSTETSATVTNISSTLRSGGDMNIIARDTATFQGANVSSGGDMTIEATNIRNLAAQDTTLETSSTTTNLMGIYLGATAGAEGGANANVSAHQSPDGNAGGQVGAEAAAGVRFRNTQETSVSGSVTQVTNTFTSGGNLNRTAKDTIVDQGTQVEAGGNITQSARVIRDEAISDSTFSSSSAQSHDARIAITAGAEAKAGNGEDAEAGTGVAGKATYEGEISSASEMETTAVTSRFRAGGNITSTSTDKTTLVGTHFEAGGDVNIEAGSLEFKAAADTSRSSETSQNISAEISVSADEVGANASYGLSTATSESSTARVGGIAAGGNININTRGDSSLEGTNLTGGGDTTIDVGGNLEIKAARDTSSSSTTNLSVQAEVGASRENSDRKGKAEAEASFESSSSNQAQVGSISTQGNLVIRSGANTTLEGTQVDAGGAAQIQAGGNVILQEAVSSSSEVGISAKASVESERKTPEKAQDATESKEVDKPTDPVTTNKRDGQFSAGAISESASTRVNIQGGGGVSIQSNVPLR